LWNNFHANDQVVPTINETLDNLKLHYIDLYLIHWPFGFKVTICILYVYETASLRPFGKGGAAYSNVGYLETWQVMEECIKLGLAKSTGISNFNAEQIQRILRNCEMKPVCNLVEVNPNFDQKELIEFCKHCCRGLLSAWSQ
ncbi:hypothetical protein NQ314_016681, partial [Rhamnusium bicolor]